ncbi:hypothetical protein BB561_006712, partial [Smittium simulii]
MPYKEQFGFRAKDECISQATTLLSKTRGEEARQKVLTKNKDIFKPSVTLADKRAVRQGCPESSMLFNIYINDTFNGITGASVPELYDKLLELLFADDTVILAESADELQKSFDTLTKWFKQYKYLGIEFNNEWNNKAFFKAKKIKAFKSYTGCCSILKRTDILTKFKVMVIKAIIQVVATYGGNFFGMSATRCKPIQQVVDAATQTLKNIAATETGEKKPPLLPDSILMGLVGKLQGEDLKHISKKICNAPTVLCVKTTLAIAKFLNAIALSRYLMLNSIRLIPIPPKQCPP